MRALIKRLVPFSVRQRYGGWGYWVNRAVSAIRNGVNPVSFLRRYRYGDQRLRLKGVNVQSDNPRLAWSLTREIVEDAEYDFPGFVPEPGWRVVDVGANIGLFSMLAASRGATVTSYEPHPSLFCHLQTNTSKWGVGCHQIAVVGEPRESVTLYPREGRDIRNTVLARDIIDGHALSGGVDVPAITISDVLARECDLLKIDIEGGEFDVFAHAGDALRNARRIVAEIHGNAGDPQEIVRTIENAGFSVTLHGRAHDAELFPLTATRLNDGPHSRATRP